MKFTHICHRILVPLASLIWIASAHSGEVENVRLKDAVAEGNVREVQAALEAGANPGSTYEGDYYVSVLGRAMSLHSAVEDESEKSTYENIVKLLVQAGALKGSNKHGSILFWPVTDGNIPLLRYLIANGANVSAKSEELTLAEIAVKYSQDEAYQILIKEGAVPVSPDSVPLLRLAQAASMFDIVAMQIQLDAGAKINGTTPDGETVLMHAFSFPLLDENQYKGIEWLLNNGADPNLGNLPLNRAILMGSTVKVASSGRAVYAMKIIKLLLSKGAKVSGATSYGKTPLHVAAKYNYLEAAKLLIKEGAKVMPKTKDGKTPLDLAESKEMIALLKKSGARE